MSQNDNNNDDKGPAISRFPLEILIQIFKNADLLGEGRGVVLAFPPLVKEVKRLVNALVSGELSLFPTAWVAQFPDFGSPANRLKILCRQRHDFEVLKQVLGASRALFAPLPLAAVPDPSLVHYLNNPACSPLSPFLLGIGTLDARNIRVASFHAFLERPDMHYRSFASVDHIAEQIAGWSRLQIL